MQPEQTNPPSQSHILVRFGNPVNPQNCPLNLTLKAQYNSAKVENKRFNAGQYLNTEVPMNSILIELQAKEDGQQLAKKLNQIRQTSPSMKELQEDHEIKITIVGKDKKVFILLIIPQLQGLLNKSNKYLTNPDMVPSSQGWLEVKLTSGNKLSRVHELIGQKGAMAAFLDSLEVDFKFNKTENLKSLIRKTLFSNAPEEQSKALLDAYECLKLNLHFDSSSSLQNFPKIMESLQILQINDDFKQIRPLLGNKFEAYIFGKPMSFIVNINAEDLYLVLDILFA